MAASLLLLLLLLAGLHEGDAFRISGTVAGADVDLNVDLFDSGGGGESDVGSDTTAAASLLRNAAAATLSRSKRQVIALPQQPGTEGVQRIIAKVRKLASTDVVRTSSVLRLAAAGNAFTCVEQSNISGKSVSTAR